jgi:hypothetical protein
MADKTFSEIEGVWDLIWENIQKGRQKKSIVSYSLIDEDPADRNNLTQEQKNEKDAIGNLLKNDVIVVSAAGNEAMDENGKPTSRLNADASPQIFSGDDYPLIVVGAIDFTNAPADFSQGGAAVTTLSPGKNINCQSRSLNFPIFKSGTSCGKSTASLFSIMSKCHYDFQLYFKSAHNDYSCV